MPACGIIQCAAKKDNIHKDLTLHLFPTNDSLRKKWLEIIGEDNIRPSCRHRPFICSLHFEQKYFNRSIQRTRLCPDAVPSLDLMPTKTTLAQNRNRTQVKAVNEAVKLVETNQKTERSAAAHRPPLKVQPEATSAPKGSTCLNCNDTDITSFTPLVIVDIPPAAAIETISPVINEKPTFTTRKESRLLSRCAFLDKQLRAWKQKVRRRVAIIDKLEGEKKELTKQHLRALELLKRGDNTDYQFEDILHKAIRKLS